MQIERELSLIVTPASRKNVRLLWKSQSRLVSGFYSALRKGEVVDDESASQAIFGEQVDAGRIRTYRSRFRERLLHNLFFLELQSSRNGAYATDLYRLHKQVFWMRVLAMFGARNSAFLLAKRALKHAELYQLTLIEIEILEHLTRHFTITGKFRAFIKTSKRLDRKMDVLRAEQASGRMYQTLAIAFVREAAPRKDILKKTQQFYEESSLLAANFNTYSLRLESLRIGIILYQLSGKFKETLALCEAAEQYFKAHAHLTPLVRYGELAVNRLESYLYLRDYEKGSETAAVCAEYFRVGSNNWFVFMEYFFLLATHTLRFNRANEIYNEVTSHPRFALQQEALREKWRVFELCMTYVNRTLGETEGNARVVALDQILNTVPIYAQDKQGYNVPILVMHILLLLERGDLNGISERVEALRTYRTRYLRASSNLHSALFLKLVTIMESNDFNYEVIAKKGAKYHAQLRTLPSAYTEVRETVQILSYAWLWDRVLERLEMMQSKIVVAK